MAFKPALLRHTAAATAAALIGTAALVAAGSALAQPPAAETETETAERRAPARDRQRAEPPAEPATNDARGELSRARSELEAAQRNLEAAAREVARLSAETVRPVVRDLQRQFLGTGQRAMLGVAIADADDGAAINAVSPGGPAAEAGLEIGDVVVAVDGQPLRQRGRSPAQVLIGRLSEVEPGTAVQLRLRRDGDERSVRIMTRERDDRAFVLDGPRLRLGPLANLFGTADRWSSMELIALSPELGEYFGTEQGLLVVQAPDDASLMLRDGDVILDIGGREPNSPEHAMRILGSFEPGETLRLRIMRRQQEQTLEIALPDEPEPTDAA